MKLHLWTFLFEALNFVVLAYVLHRLLYRPLRQAIDNRRAAIFAAQASAEHALQEASALEKQLKTKLSEVEQQRQETMHQALSQAQAERDRLLAEAATTRQRDQAELRQALDRERSEGRQALQGEIIGQAIDLTRRLLEQAAGNSLDEQLTQRLADTLHSLPAEQREQVRTHWQTSETALLEVAHPLPGAIAITQLTEAAAAVVGTPLSLIVQTRPDLIAGARLRLGGHLWDSSLAGQLPGKEPGARGEQ